MKKNYKYAIVAVIIVFGLVLLVLLNNMEENDGDDFSSAQLVEVYDYSTNELIVKYQSRDEIAKLIENLNFEEWDIGEIDEGDYEKYLLKLYQKPTKTLLKKEDNELKEIGTIIIYNSGEYVDFKVNKIDLTFKTNKDISTLFD